MHKLKYMRGMVHRSLVEMAKQWARCSPSVNPATIKREDWAGSLSDPSAFYLRCFRAFRQLPRDLIAHRAYFTSNKRGFGEDAFHTLWYLLFREFHPGNFLEIGVYRGQVISLIALLARVENRSCHVAAVSPFTDAGDNVSTYASTVDYFGDTLTNFDHFGLEHPELLKAFSTDAAARVLISGRSWDMIYIDGCHEYEIARQDWELCAGSVREGGVIILDDAGRSTSYQPRFFATAGHPGPSRLATEISRKDFREILQVGHNRVFQKIGNS